MTIPSNATMQGINVELGRSATQALYMNDAIFRDMAWASMTPNTPVQISQCVGHTMTLIWWNPVTKDPSFNVYGFSDGAFGGNVYGALAPTSVFAGVQIQKATTAGTSMDFIVYGNRAQALFNRFNIRDNPANSPLYRYLSASADQYAPSAPNTRWSWVNGQTFALSAYNGSALYMGIFT